MLLVGLPTPLLLLLWSTVSVFGQSPSANSSKSTSGTSTTPAPSSSGSSSGSISASATSSAAFPSLSGYSACVTNCLELAISQVGCDSVVDVNCYCHNATSFVHNITGCVSSQCSGDLASAESVSQLFCNIASPNVSLSFSPLPSSSSSTSFASGPTSSPPPSSSASASSSGSIIPSSSSSASSSAGSGQTNSAAFMANIPNLIMPLCIALFAATFIP